MPRDSFGQGALLGLASGGTKLFQAILDSQKSYQQGYDQTALTHSRLAQARSSQIENEAQARKYGVEADDIQSKTAVRDRRPELYEEQAALASGYDIPTVRALRQTVAGNRPLVPMGPPTEAGDLGVGSFQISPEGRSRISLALRQYLPLVANSGDLDPSDLATSAQKYRSLELEDDLFAKRRSPVDVAEVVSAVGGKAQSQGPAKPPSGYRWSGDALEPIPGGPATRPSTKGDQSLTQADKARLAILGQEFFNNREKMATATGEELVRLKGDELALITEIRGTPFKGDVKALKDLMAVGQSANTPPKANAEVQRQIGGIISVQQDLAALEDALKDFDPRSPADQTNLAKRARITSLAKQAQLNAKEAAALGALSGPDMGLLEGILADPTSPRGILFGGAGVAAQLKEARLGNERRIQALKQQYGDKNIPNLPSLPNAKTPGVSADQSGNSPTGVIQRNYRVDY